MADAEAEEVRLRTARDWPYAQRIADGNWKIRRDAFEDAKTECSRGGPADAALGKPCR